MPYKDLVKKKEYAERYKIENAGKIKASNAKYRAENAEKVKASKAKWISENAEQIKISSEKYRIENPEKRKETCEKYLANNPDKRKESSLKYRNNNLEKVKKANSNWFSKNLEKAVAYVEARRARILGNGGSYTVPEWNALCERYGNKCLACGSSEKLTVDHVIPIKLGGRSSIENLQPLCQSCNSRKGAKHIDYRTGVTI